MLFHQILRRLTNHLRLNFNLSIKDFSLPTLITICRWIFTSGHVRKLWSLSNRHLSLSKVPDRQEVKNLPGEAVDVILTVRFDKTAISKAYYPPEFPFVSTASWLMGGLVARRLQLCFNIISILLLKKSGTIALGPGWHKINFRLISASQRIPYQSEFYFGPPNIK